MLLWALSSLLAGIFTALSPCVLPLLPAIFTKKLAEGSSKLGALFAGLLSSIILLTLLIISPKAFFTFPLELTRYFSAFVLAFFSLMILFPEMWTKIMQALKVQRAESKILQLSSKSKLLSDYLLGFALGFSFTSCSPTYFTIIGIIFPQSILLGAFYFGLFLVGFLGVLFGLLFFIFKRVKVKGLVFFKKQKHLMASIMLFLALSMAFSWDKLLVSFLLEAFSIFNAII